MAFISLFFTYDLTSIFLIGAVVTGNVLGNLRNKIGQVVAFSWKGINVFRSYVIPTYSNTVPQIAQRLKFRYMLMFAQYLKGQIIDPYWSLHGIKMSPFNAFMQTNLKAYTGPIDYSKMILAKGTITPTLITSATKTVADVSIHWAGDLVGNQLATDFAIGVVYEEDSNIMFFSVGDVERADEAIGVTTETGLAVTNMHAYLFFYRDINLSSFAVSNSDRSAVTQA